MGWLVRLVRQLEFSVRRMGCICSLGRADVKLDNQPQDWSVYSCVSFEREEGVSDGFHHVPSHGRFISVSFES